MLISCIFHPICSMNLYPQVSHPLTRLHNCHQRLFHLLASMAKFLLLYLFIASFFRNLLSNPEFLSRKVSCFDRNHPCIIIQRKEITIVKPVDPNQHFTYIVGCLFIFLLEYPFKGRVGPKTFF